MYPTRNSPKYSNDQKYTWIKIDSNFTARETQDYPPSQRQATNKQTNKLLTTLKHSNEFTYSHFPCHLKVNWDKLASSYRRWKCKKGKRLTITANFQERNLGAALIGKKIRPVGRIVKSEFRGGAEGAAAPPFSKHSRTTPPILTVLEIVL